MKSKITLLTAAVLLLTTCNHYQLTQEDRALLKKYPETYLSHNGYSHLVRARRLEIADSIQKAHQQDLSQEFKEEQYQNNTPEDL
ncbi:hypothetical protein [Riemerella anatipestifer]|uniref:Uncharacterized protein n=2 Tax=Riemerella anatipestifer TaxID=34085 RepID=J9QTT2_RIEAN|nr:hypothetical protein [Riemerella anatipestifer]AFR36381.1 hypothetical protein B739_1797 [Riemerella anatipestifer RA-CH-1]AIH03341.1 hypothetical protein M949_2175 [Riemerella anatipestifer CH3]AQY22858.1 hypothetical protein AB406_1917 [Riemerella anatipestifer]AZZ57799.1 hypothetical protein AWB57_01355 [Riemerella anatipestifer]MCO4303828.1 hypothetical protein [Riemerella anatipestifer]